MAVLHWHSRWWLRLRHVVVVVAEMRRERAVGHVGVFIRVALHSVQWCQLRVWRKRDVALIGRWCRHWRAILRVALAIRAWTTSSDASTPAGQCCGSCSCSFLHGSSVVVLVTRQSCSARKRLLAIRIRTLIWTLSGMNSSMSGQRTRITEWLSGSQY